MFCCVQYTVMVNDPNVRQTMYFCHSWYKWNYLQCWKKPELNYLNQRFLTFKSYFLSCTLETNKVVMYISPKSCADRNSGNRVNSLYQECAYFKHILHCNRYIIRFVDFKTKNNCHFVSEETCFILWCTYHLIRFRKVAE